MLIRPLAYVGDSENYPYQWDTGEYDIYHFWIVKTSWIIPMFSLLLPWQLRRPVIQMMSCRSGTSISMGEGETPCPAQA